MRLWQSYVCWPQCVLFPSGDTECPAEVPGGGGRSFLCAEERMEGGLVCPQSLLTQAWQQSAATSTLHGFGVFYTVLGFPFSVFSSPSLALVPSLLCLSLISSPVLPGQH